MLTVTAPVFVSNDANSVEPESLALFLEETFWCNVPPGTILVDINHTYNHLIMVVEGLLSVCAPHPEHRFTPTRFLGPGAPYNPALLPGRFAMPRSDFDNKQGCLRSKRGLDCRHVKVRGV